MKMMTAVLLLLTVTLTVMIRYSAAEETSTVSAGKLITLNFSIIIEMEEHLTCSGISHNAIFRNPQAHLSNGSMRSQKLHYMILSYMYVYIYSRLLKPSKFYQENTTLVYRMLRF